MAAWVRCKGGWNQLFSGNTNHRQVFQSIFSFLSFLLCITSSCGLLSGVAAGGIICPGVLVGCLQEAEMIIKPILNDLFGISTSRTNTFFCIFTDLNSIAVNKT